MVQENLLRIAVRKFPPFEFSIREAWQKFCAATGCDAALEMRPMDLPELYDSILSKNGLANDHWDIAHISSDWIKEAIKATAVENLDPFIHNTEINLAHWPESLTRRQFHENKIYGIPFHDGPECLIYRKDLFENKTHQSAYRERFDKELAPPGTWEDFHNTAVFFSNINDHFYGTALAAFPDGHNAVYDFCIQAWTRGGNFINPDNTINVYSETIIEGLKYYRNLFQDKNAVHPDSKNFDSVQLGKAFAKGEIAMMINWFGFAAYAELDKNASVKGKIDVAPIPHSAAANSVSPNSYWMYGIGAGSNKKKTAYDFIRFATDPQQDKALTLNGGIGCRIATWHDDEINAKIPYFHKLEALHQHAVELPDIPHWHELSKVIDNIMLCTVNSNDAIENILQEAQDFIHKNF